MEYISRKVDTVLKNRIILKLCFLYIYTCIFTYFLKYKLHILQSDRSIVWTVSLIFTELTILGRIPSFLFAVSPPTSSDSGRSSAGEKHPLVCTLFVSCGPFLTFWLLAAENTN